MAGSGTRGFTRISRVRPRGISVPCFWPAHEEKYGKKRARKEANGMDLVDAEMILRGRNGKKRHA
jgi:hypothetical protein